MMNKKTKYLALEFLIYLVLFVLSISLFPMCNFYFEGDDFEMITEPIYFNDLKIAYAFPVFFALVLMGFLSLKKVVIIILNTTVILASFLTFVIFQLSFAWWGASPFHPDLQAGYWLTQIVLFVFLIRTFIEMGSLSHIQLNKAVRLTSFILAILIPVSLITYTIVSYTKIKNEPIMRSEWSRVERDRWVTIEAWDYSEAYDAHVSKYFSTDTLKTEEYRLDSVRFTYFDDNSNIVDQFTIKASNGKLDIEKILEEND